MDDIYYVAFTALQSFGRYPTDREAEALTAAISDYLGEPDGVTES